MSQCVRSSLTMKLMEKIADDELSDKLVEETFSALAKEAGSDDFVARCRKIWDEERVFSVPQPGLRNGREDFGIFSNEDALKRISGRFTKRVLIRARIASDEFFEKAPVPVIARYASLPFGLKPCKELFQL